MLPNHESKEVSVIARPVRLVFAVLAVAAMVGTVELTDRLAERRAVDTEIARLSGVARLTASGYRRQVDKFRLVATTLSADPDVEAVLDSDGAPERIRLNQRLASLTEALDASVIYLLDGDGTTTASSNWRRADSFLGENYGFRNYFIRALEQGEWEQYALGTRSSIAGLFVARRVRTGTGRMGVIVVKIRFDRLENEWAASSGIAFVTNRQGVILVTSKPEWRFETVGVLDPMENRRLSAQVEFGKAPLRQNVLFAQGAVARSSAEFNAATRYIVATEPLANGWNVQLLAPIDKAVTAAKSFSHLVLALVLASVGGLATAYAVRARAIVAHQQRENENRIAELKDRLVQANKLSTLGQITAGVGHEINQPLTAIGIRALSARKLVEQRRLDDADAALEEIGALTARAGAITGELRRFSRRAKRQVGVVKLSAVAEGTRLLIGDQLRSSRTRLVLKNFNLSVIGEQGCLEQVFVNLIQNAIDALGNYGTIAISARRERDMVKIKFEDNGPGLPTDVQERLFQPFTSSKESGLGLGLVICRDIAADLGGELSHISGGRGACFMLTLKLAQ